MKRKIISSLFALVLLAGLSLMPAVPAGAVEPVTRNVVPFILEGLDDATAEWSILEAHTGSSSVKLTDGTGAYKEARVKVPYGDTLGSLTNDGLDYWVKSIDFKPMAAIIELDVDTDGFVDVVLHSTNIPTQDNEEWAEDSPTDLWAGKDLRQVNTTYPGMGMWWNGTDWTAETAATAVYDTLANWITSISVVSGTTPVLRVGAITVGADTGMFYVDDITINGITYYGLIQDAIDTATALDTVSVAAGTYTEQLVIGTSLTLQGESKETTTIKSPATLTKTGWTHDGKNFYPVIEVNGATAHAITVDVSGFTIDGDYNFDIGEPGVKRAFTGIVYRNADGRIESNEIKNFRDEPLSALQYGEGIWIVPGSTVTIATSNIHDYNKTGVRVSGVGAEATVTGSTVTGCGPTDVIAQNGVLLIGGATGTVSNNTVTGHSYTPEPQSCAILIFSAGSGVKVQDNPTLDSNDIGIAVYYSDDSTVKGNTISSNGVGVDIYDADASTADTIQVNYNNITTNSVYGVYNEGSLGTVDATMNWWGDVSGPEHHALLFEGWPNNPGGLGNVVSNNVDYAPWLTREFETVLADNIAYFGIPMVWLDTGWNTLSTPIALDPGCDTWGEYVTLGDGLSTHSTSPAYAFDPTVTPPWVPLTGDYRLKACDAIYVRMAKPDIAAILLSPDVSVPSKELYAGWNLVGLAYLPPGGPDGCMPLGVVLETVYTVTGDLTGWSLVVNPPLNQWEPWDPLAFFRSEFAPGTPEVSPLMCITQGYWVFMRNPGTLAGFSFTPIPLGMPTP